MATKVDWGEAGDYLLVGGPAHGVSFPHYGMEMPDRINAGGRAYVKGTDPRVADHCDRPWSARWVGVYFHESLHPRARQEWLTEAEKKAFRSARL